jgi:hypothetical protein
MELTLHDQILAIVEDSSGGIKFIDLVSRAVFEASENGTTGKDLDDLPDLIEKEIRNSKDMKILEYTWRAMSRQKMFVYTP